MPLPCRRLIVCGTPKDGTPEADTLEILVTLVEAYEKDRYELPPPDPIDALEYFLESRGWTRKDLEPCIGSRGRVSEIMSRKRPLTISMIRNLERATGIPASILIQPYATEQRQNLDRQTPRSSPAVRSKEVVAAD
jgi:HTH-type transcriptional regulator/antitoxin HigA